MRTRLLGPRSHVRLSGANEHRDEPSLALLKVELADESDAELADCITITTSSTSGPGCRFRFLATVFGNKHSSGNRRSVIRACT